ncbi:9900_t:CDS:2 [Dentiscutata erythropus]|uniref:9900_t:CDS:1 n=1 Tax=Dentiscutata erythropus TaxID=1348616 RepID=A0A9N9E072_9GLOM|nr:9900_t:CDS:2 [Dentiscutata erythropus]
MTDGARYWDTDPTMATTLVCASMDNSNFFRLTRGITLHEPLGLQSADNTLTAIPPRNKPLTSVEHEILGQLDSKVFNISTPINIDVFTCLMASHQIGLSSPT